MSAPLAMSFGREATGLAVERFEGETFAPALAALLPTPADFYDDPVWFRVFAETCLPAGAGPRVDHVRDGGGTVLVLPVVPKGRTLAALANFYTCRFGPWTGTAIPSEAVAAAAEVWGRELRRAPGRPARLWLEALEDPRPLAAGLRRAGWLTEIWPQFGNWFLPTAGLDFAAYWRARHSRLRNTVERKERALRREGRMEIFTPDDAEVAADLYQQVHDRSWKPAEPFPCFIPELIRAGFDRRAVRVAILAIDGVPAAAQLWVVHRRRATIFKLSYAEEWARWSPGSILTRHMMRTVLDEGCADEIDFGWGDDPYKRDWLPERRQRWGLAAYDPATPVGLALAARNLLPRLIRRIGQGAWRNTGRPDGHTSNGDPAPGSARRWRPPSGV